MGVVLTAGKYTDVRRTPDRGVVGSGARPHLPNILVRKHRSQTEPMHQWMERELREGRLLDTYLRRERHKMEGALRQTAARMRDARPNPRCDFKLVAKVPGRLYHRWRQQDKHFWLDDSNLKSLRRDNEPLRQCIFV